MAVSGMPKDWLLAQAAKKMAVRFRGFKMFAVVQGGSSSAPEPGRRGTAAAHEVPPYVGTGQSHFHAA